MTGRSKAVVDVPEAAPGRKMRVSAIVSVGPKKKKGTNRKKRSERVQPVLVEEPGERKPPLTDVPFLPANLGAVSFAKPAKVDLLLFWRKSTRCVTLRNCNLLPA